MRSTALRLACLSRSQTEAFSSLNAQESFKGCSTKNSDLLEMLARAAGAILHFDMFSTMNKLVLIQKMCNITLSSPPTMATLTSAMHYFFPFFKGLWRKAVFQAMRKSTCLIRSSISYMIPPC